MTQQTTRRKIVVQFLEYMVGGGVYFWSGLAVFALCFNVFHWHWLVAKGLADAVGWTLGFLVQRYWAFYDSRLKGHDKPVVIRYVSIRFVDLAIDYMIVASFVHFGLTPYLGFVASATFLTVWDYLWFRFWVFRPKAS